ncbi:MAG: prolipoprotein diacylglyceryl transferase [Elusimicrobia bacterium]|nr:prolipoprotein diacylglyceryl transferase [Elusimicrobiota bacterium]
MRPILFSFSHFDMRSASAFAGLSALAAYLYFRRHRERLGLSLEEFWELILAMMAGVFLGAAAVFLVLDGPGVVANVERTLRARRLLGGSFFGVFWGAAAAAGLVCRRRRLDLGRVADVLAAAGLLGLAIMRVGCLLNGCCYGRPSGGSWGLVFTDAASRVPIAWLGVALHPVQLYEAAGDLAIFLFLNSWALPRVHGGRLRPGTSFWLGVAAYSLLRFLLDFLRVGRAGLLNFGGLGTSQWLALAGLAAAAYFLARRRVA